MTNTSVDSDDDKLSIRDKRRGVHWQDDAIFDVFGHEIGPYAIAVYGLLCRRADKNGRSFASLKSMAHQTGCSRASVTRAISILVQSGLVERSERYDEKGRTSSEYVLVPMETVLSRRSDLSRQTESYRAAPMRPDTSSYNESHPDSTGNNSRSLTVSDQSVSVSVSSEAQIESHRGEAQIELDPRLTQSRTPGSNRAMKEDTVEGRHSRKEENLPTLLPETVQDDGESPYFTEAWENYPKRDGSNSRKGALLKWEATLKKYPKAEREMIELQMLEGTKRYKAYNVARDKIGTPYVMQATRFFGPDEHWREDWPEYNWETGEGLPEGYKPWQCPDDCNPYHRAFQEKQDRVFWSTEKKEAHGLLPGPAGWWKAYEHPNP